MRLLSPLLLALAAGGLAAAGCGSDNNDNGGSTATASTPPPAAQTQPQTQATPNPAPKPKPKPKPKASTHTTTTPAPSKAAANAPVAITADPNGNLAFEQKSLSAKAGKDTFHFVNQASLAHGFTIQGNGVNASTKIISQSSQNLAVTLKPGKYTFFCPVPGHRQAGMQGTLTVTQ